MTPRPAKETRANFEAGRVDQWTAGGYGCAVQVRSEKGRLRIFWPEPGTRRRRERTLFSTDSQELRRRAAAEAVALSEALRAGTVAQEEKGPALTAETITLFDVCFLYMQGRVPGFTAEMMEWAHAKVDRWYRDLRPEVRANVPSAATVYKDLGVFRTLFQHPRFARDRRVSEMEPGDWRLAQQQWLQEGYSPRTIANWRDRLSLVFREPARGGEGGPDEGPDPRVHEGGALPPAGEVGGCDRTGSLLESVGAARDPAQRPPDRRDPPPGRGRPRLLRGDRDLAGRVGEGRQLRSR